MHPDPFLLAKSAGLDLPAQRLKSLLENSSPLVVAYSGGVDSSLLLAIAHHTLQANCLGVIADSPSLPRQALQAALKLAKNLHAKVEILQTNEFKDPRYTSNPINRCYFCKAELFQRLNSLARNRGFRAIAYGENADDPPSERPGSRAAREFSILAPLREANLGKASIRKWASLIGLPNSSAPAQPCLSSRIPHGVPVTREAVALVERAEAALRNLGFKILRVRYHPGPEPRALVQFGPAELEYALSHHADVIHAVRSAGFSSVEIDPQGYRGAGLK